MIDFAEMDELHALKQLGERARRRDETARAALTGMLANTLVVEAAIKAKPESWEKMIVEGAYKFADEMEKHRT